MRKYTSRNYKETSNDKQEYIAEMPGKQHEERRLAEFNAHRIKRKQREAIETMANIKMLNGWMAVTLRKRDFKDPKLRYLKP